MKQANNELVYNKVVITRRSICDSMGSDPSVEPTAHNRPCETSRNTSNKVDECTNEWSAYFAA